MAGPKPDVRGRLQVVRPGPYSLLPVPCPLSPQ